MRKLLECERKIITKVIIHRGQKYAKLVEKYRDDLDRLFAILKKVKERTIGTVYFAVPNVMRITENAIEVVRCKDCIYGYLYIDVQNGVTDSWIECRNPEGLNRDVSVDGYCSASIRRT